MIFVDINPMIEDVTKITDKVNACLLKLSKIFLTYYLNEIIFSLSKMLFTNEFRESSRGGLVY